MRSGAKPGSSPTVTRQRSKAAARALRRRDMRMGQGSARRPTVEPSRRQSGRNTSKGFASSSLQSLPDGEKLWWMIAVPSRELLRRIPFVIGVMGLLAVGLAATLWLTTRSTGDASALSVMRAHNRELQQEQERLQREMEQGKSVAELARKAGDMGMVPARDVAKLVPRPDGSVQLVGQLKPAEGAPEAPLGGEAPKPDAPADRRPPPQAAPPAPSEPEDAAPPAPVPAQPDDSVERVHPPQDAPPPQAPQAQQPAQEEIPGLPQIPPPAPSDQSSPIAQAGNQSPAVPQIPPALYTPPPPRQLPAPAQPPAPAPESAAPPENAAPEPVASESPPPDQPQQEPHE